MCTVQKYRASKKKISVTD